MQVMQAIQEPAKTYKRMQLMSSPRSNFQPVFMQRPWGAQGNKGTRSLTHEPVNVKEMIKHELQTSNQGLVSKVQSTL